MMEFFKPAKGSRKNKLTDKRGYLDNINLEIAPNKCYCIENKTFK